MADTREHEGGDYGEDAKVRRGAAYCRPVELRPRLGEEAPETTGKANFILY